MIMMSYWQTVSHLGEDRGDTEEEEADHNHGDCEEGDETSEDCPVQAS